MDNKKFEVIASTTEIIMEEEKKAVRIELQYGKAGKPTEIVFAELYWKDGNWKYTPGQVRIECTADNATHVLKAVKALYEASAKVEKKDEPKKGVDVDKMSDAEKAKLLELLLKSAKTETKAKDDSSELKLENIIINKRPVKSNRK